MSGTPSAWARGHASRNDPDENAEAQEGSGAQWPQNSELLNAPGRTTVPTRLHRLITTISLVLAATIALAAAPLARLYAQTWQPDASRRGALALAADEQPGTGALPLVQRRAAFTLASAILDVFRRDPALASPVGYMVKLHRVIGSRGSELGREPAMPFYAGVSGAYWGYFLEDGKPDADASGKTPIDAYANTLWACPNSEDFAVEDRGKPMLDGGPPILTGGRRTGEFRGHPVYNGQCIVITNRAEPPFLPVTRERYMKLEILGMRAKVDRFRKQVDYDHLDANWRTAYDNSLKQSEQIIAGREAEIARMSATDRGAPAAVRHNGPSDSTLVSPDDTDALPLVTINPAFFDRSLPPSKAQVIIVNLPFLQPGVKPDRTPDEPARRAHGEKIRDQLDWASLESMVKP